MPCKEFVNVACQRRAHLIKVRCYKKNVKMNCKQKCLRILECGHECLRKCYEPCQEVSPIMRSVGFKTPCSKIIRLKFDCGHSRMVTCGKLSAMELPTCEKCFSIAYQENI
jgi:hypothetical protein